MNDKAGFILRSWLPTDQQRLYVPAVKLRVLSLLLCSCLSSFPLIRHIGTPCLVVPLLFTQCPLFSLNARPPSATCMFLRQHTHTYLRISNRIRFLLISKRFSRPFSSAATKFIMPPPFNQISPPAPTFTEKDVGDLSGKVCIP